MSEQSRSRLGQAVASTSSIRSSTVTACRCQPSACARNGLVGQPGEHHGRPDRNRAWRHQVGRCGGQVVGVAVQPAHVRRSEGPVPQVGDRDGDVVERVADTALVDVEQADDLVAGDDELAFVEITVDERQRSLGRVVERALQLVSKAGEPVALRREYRCQQCHVVWAVSEAMAHRHEIVGVDGSEATDQLGERRWAGHVRASDFTKSRSVDPRSSAMTTSPASMSWPTISGTGRPWPASSSWRRTMPAASSGRTILAYQAVSPSSIRRTARSVGRYAITAVDGVADRATP